MDPAWLAEAFDGVSSARTDVQRACELVALGYLGACMGADTAMNQRTRDFYKAMNPERGQRTGRWMAHALVDRWPGQPDRSAFRRASTLLAEHFPLPGELCEISRRILADASDGNGEITRLTSTPTSPSWLWRSSLATSGRLRSRRFSRRLTPPAS